jgi:hypothetical protein
VSLGASLALCAVAAFAVMPDEKPGFEQINPVTYGGMFTDAVQAQHIGHKAEAFGKFMRLACGGDKAAQEEVGLMYLVGEGVEKNTATAYLWLKTAAEFNLASFRTLTTKIEDAMTPEQRTHFGQLADEMRERYGQRATNVTCSAHSSSTFSSNIKDSVLCSPRRGGSMLQVQRCYATEEAAAEAAHDP